MTNLIVKEHNTGTDAIVERPMTTLELNQHTAAGLEWEQSKTRELEMAAAKEAAQAKLAELGLTADDLKALGL